ncbi:MAG: hypothetical protein PHZ09_03500 [Eubacteriales bacterium]|jgi:hypothetical protein|nr:hypothetical protein [Eubacteriales bacterium]
MSEQEISRRHRKRNFYKCFSDTTVDELESRLIEAATREEKAFYRSMLNLKLQLEQEKIVGEMLV